MVPLGARIVESRDGGACPLHVVAGAPRERRAALAKRRNQRHAPATLATVLRGPAIATVLGASALASVVIASSGDPEPPGPEPAVAADQAPPDQAPAIAPPARSPTATPLPAPPTVELPRFDPRMAPRWIAAASGAVPELNQVSLEQDLALAAEVLGPEGRVLFGAGPGTATVQVLAPPSETDPVLLALGDLFDPRGGRDLRYRPTTLQTAEPATAEAVLGALDHALAGGPDPLLLYLGGHGNIGDRPAHNTISLWEQSVIDVIDLAEHLDRSPRPVRVVATTCFSGGFAELVFRGADETQGASPHDRCGLFAAPWDLEASGCDPNPDRGTQEGYGLHVLNALRGRDRDGTPLPISTLDLDGDRHISLLEAHTRARIASPSADVPTTTAERWLRHAAPEQGPEAEVSLPEEEAVIDALAERLHLRGKELQAHLELQRLGDDIEAVLRRLEDAQQEEDAAYRRAAADLLARWPVLDDPWHPEHRSLVERERRAIGEHLERSPTYDAYVAARQEVDRLGGRLWELRRRSAPYERLTRALDNRTLARRLRAEGGEDWSTFERILACERGRI